MFFKCFPVISSTSGSGRSDAEYQILTIQTSVTRIKYNFVYRHMHQSLALERVKTKEKLNNNLCDGNMLISR